MSVKEDIIVLRMVVLLKPSESEVNMMEKSSIRLIRSDDTFRL